MDDDVGVLDRARRLLARVMKRLLVQSVLAWRAHTSFEKQVKELEALVDPVADVFDKLPENRTPEDIQRLLPLVSKIELYKHLHQPVREFLAGYAQLVTLCDKVELPRGPHDNTCLFSVIYGDMTALLGDSGDPALATIMRHAAAELQQSLTPEASTAPRAAAAAAPAAAAPAEHEVAPQEGAPQVEPSAVSSSGGGGAAGELLSEESSTVAGAAEVLAVADNERRLIAQRTMRMHGLDSGLDEKALEKVSGSLWRTVIETINNLVKLQKAVQLRQLAAQHATSLEDAAAAAAAACGGSAGNNTALTAGLAALGRADEASMRLLPALEALKVQAARIGQWLSFSGRDLHCQEEMGDVSTQHHHTLHHSGGSVSGGVGVGGLPGRSIAAITPARGLVALVSVSKEVFRRAMAMQSEISTRRAVDSCCRLPFLRHTPLKELYRVARHVSELTFEKGQVVLHQGRENGVIFFLVSGEVEVTLELPDSSDPQVLSAALAALSGAKPSAQQLAALSQHHHSTRSLLQDGSGGFRGSMLGSTEFATGSGEQLAAELSSANVTASGEQRAAGAMALFGATRRVVLGRRGAGVVLGDDALREKRMAVGAVAASRCVLLAISPQRFTQCCDPLTLRLFHKLRLQHSATAVISAALLQVDQRGGVLTKFREAVLDSSYDVVPTTLKQGALPEAPKWLAASMRPGELEASADQLYQQRMAAKGIVVAPAPVEDGCGSQREAMEQQRILQEQAALAAALKAKPGITAFRVQEALGSKVESGSLAAFLQRVKQDEVARDSPYWPKGPPPAAPPPLDLSGLMGGGCKTADRRYTDMLEAACMAVIKVDLLPGQLDVRLDPLAQVLDDVVVQWSDLAHRTGLQLVRWRSHEYFLVAPLDLSMGGRKRPLLRVVADTLLAMAKEFRHALSQSEVPHLAMSAGVAIGGLFNTYDAGHFLVAIGGQAHTAAQHLCRMAAQQRHWRGTILLADSVTQALARTHAVQFSACGAMLLEQHPVAPRGPRGVGAPSGGGGGTKAPAGGEGGGGGGGGGADSANGTGSGEAPAGEGSAEGGGGSESSRGPRLRTVRSALMEEDDEEPVSPGTRPYYQRNGGLPAARTYHFARGGQDNGAELPDGEPNAARPPVSLHAVSNHHTPAGTTPRLAVGSSPMGSPGPPTRRPGLPPPLVLDAAAMGSAPVTIPGEDRLTTPNPITAHAAMLRSSTEALRPGALLLPGDGAPDGSPSGRPPGGMDAPDSPAMFATRQQGRHGGPTSLAHAGPAGLRALSQPPVRPGPGQQHDTHAASPSGLQRHAASFTSAQGGGAQGAPASSAAAFSKYDDALSEMAPGGLRDSYGLPAPRPGGNRPTANAQRREKAASSTAMDHRQKLRAEVAELRRQQQAQQQQQQVHAQHARQRQGDRPDSSQDPWAKKNTYVTPLGTPASPGYHRSAPWEADAFSSPGGGSLVQGAPQGEPAPSNGSPQSTPGSRNVRGETSPAKSRFAPLDRTPGKAPAGADVQQDFGAGQAGAKGGDGGAGDAGGELPPLERSSSPTHAAAAARPAGQQLQAALSRSRAVSRDRERSPAGRILPPGVPSRRALSPLRDRGPSLYMPFSAVDPVTGSPLPGGAAGAPARGGGSPAASGRLPPAGPPGAAGAGTPPRNDTPKMVACNFGYVPVRSSMQQRGARRLSYDELAWQQQQQQEEEGGGAAGDGCRRVLPLGGASSRRVANGNSRSAVFARGAPADPEPLHPDSPAFHTSLPRGNPAPNALGQWAPTPSAAAAAAAAAHKSRAASPVDQDADASGPHPGTHFSQKSRSRSHGRRASDTSVAANSRANRSSVSPPSRQAPGTAATHGSAALVQPQQPQRNRKGHGWQDLGSQRAAEQYAASLPIGLMNVSFSTAGLSRVPPLQRLLSLENLALSFNHLVGLTSEQLMGLSCNLQVVNLVCADLSELPLDFGALLPGLTELNLCSNRLSGLPPTLGCMTRLQCLSVAHNRLAALPPSLWGMVSLQHLHLGSNQLQALSEGLGQLKQLQVLNVSHNQLACLPASTTGLSDSLSSLDASYNRITHLPPSFLASMTRLVTLSLDFNSLWACPQLGGSAGDGAAAQMGYGSPKAGASKLSLLGRGVGFAEPSAEGSSSALGTATASPQASARGGPAAGAVQPTAGAEQAAAANGSAEAGASGSGAASAAQPQGEVSFAPTAGQPTPRVSQGGALRQQASARGSGRPPPLAVEASGASAGVSWAASPRVGGSQRALQQHQQHLPHLKTLALASNGLVQVPTWIPAGLEVLDVSRNNIRQLPAWLFPRLAPSLLVLQLQNNKLEALSQEVKTLKLLQMLALDENPISSPERVNTPEGAGWAAEWLYRKKYRTRPEIMAALGQDASAANGADGQASVSGALSPKGG